jgi:multidrug efflux pump subunit AcrA (membrane-fusion protein)
MKKFIKKFILPAVLLAVIAGVVVNGCQKYWNSRHLQLSGTLELTEHSLGARVPGRLETLTVDEGDEVKKGQLLGTLDRYEQVKRDLERTEQFYKDGGATQQELERAQLALRDQTIESPVDGVVLVKVREVGEVLGGGSPVLVVGDRQKMWVRVYVPEGLVNRVRMHQAATLQLDGLDRVYKRHVTTVATKAEFTPRNIQTPEERITQTFAVKVLLDEVDSPLRPGVAVDVQMDIQEPNA